VTLYGRFWVAPEVPCRDVQCDEIWGYVYKKEGHKNPWEANEPGIGDQYCFIAT